MKEMTITASEVLTDEEVDAGLEPTLNEDTTQDRRQYPTTFYCPMSDRVIQEPVVAPNGISYDKAADTFATFHSQSIDKTNTTISYYPNRALKSIIEHEVLRNENSIRSKIHSINHIIQSSLGELVEMSALGYEHRPLTNAFYCPITRELIHDPGKLPFDERGKKQHA